MARFMKVLCPYIHYKNFGCHFSTSREFVYVLSFDVFVHLGWGKPEQCTITKPAEETRPASYVPSLRTHYSRPAAQPPTNFRAR